MDRTPGAFITGVTMFSGGREEGLKSGRDASERDLKLLIRRSAWSTPVLPEHQDKDCRPSQAYQAEHKQDVADPLRAQAIR